LKEKNKFKKKLNKISSYKNILIYDYVKLLWEN
jgi:hypothetical protein